MSNRSIRRTLNAIVVERTRKALRRRQFVAAFEYASTVLAENPRHKGANEVLFEVACAFMKTERARIFLNEDVAEQIIGKIRMHIKRRPCAKRLHKAERVALLLASRRRRA